MIKPGGIYVQIGTKDGNDEFQYIMSQNNPALVILIEPNTEHNGLIKEYYKEIPNIHIENVAIVAEATNYVKLVHPVKVGDIVYDSGKFSILPMDDWGNDLIEITAPAMTFMQLCDKYDIKEINYLQIDTEGYDAEIIKSIDFDKVKIDIIKYEIWEFTPDCFKRHGAKAKHYGTAGMVEVERLLSSLGYKFEKMKYDIIAYRDVESKFISLINVAS